MATIISIVSGKGGVGKSVIAANMAETMAGEGRTVALFDADPGQGACATLLNEAPRRSAIEASADVRSCWHACSSGPTLVQAAADPLSGDPAQHHFLTVMSAQLEALAEVHDLVILDAPAGIGDVVRWTIDRSDLAALVLVDEPTSVADGYRLVKAVWQVAPAFRFGAIVNFAESDAHGRDVWSRFGLITRRFTGNGPFYLGSVPFSTDVRRSVARQQPFVRDHESLAAHVRAIAAAADEQAKHARYGLHLQ